MGEKREKKNLWFSLASKMDKAESYIQILQILHSLVHTNLFSFILHHLLYFITSFVVHFTNGHL